VAEKTDGKISKIRVEERPAKRDLRVGGKRIKPLVSNACLPQAGSAHKTSSEAHEPHMLQDEALWIIFLLHQ
jgi:hypothetical protein